MIVVYQGLPGAGKSMMTARILISVLYRNKKYFEKTGIKRKVYHNLSLSLEFKEEFKDFLEEWSEPTQLIFYRNADVFIDEISTYFDATQWANMPLSVKRWLQQHRKHGVEIYANTQDFGQVDISVRRLTYRLFNLKKVCGSRDISATLPPPRFVWGLITKTSIDPKKYDPTLKNVESFPSFLWLSRADISVYDTTAEVLPGKLPPLQHYERVCTDCGHVKISHL